MSYKIVPATRDHALALLATLRAGDRAEMLAIGGSLEDVLIGSLDQSLFASAAIETGGEVIALWGISADSPMADCGAPWLLTGTAVERHKKSFLRENKAWIADMQRIFPRLENYVDSRYTRCLHWLEWLGFTLCESRLVGCVEFYRFEKVR